MSSNPPTASPKDDLVYLLEHMAAKVQLEALGTLFSPTVKVPTSQLAQLLQEAANEIKRLRVIETLYKTSPFSTDKNPSF